MMSLNFKRTILKDVIFLKMQKISGLANGYFRFVKNVIFKIVIFIRGFPLIFMSPKWEKASLNIGATKIKSVLAPCYTLL